jgi:molybdenum cofactor biosynthesis enzyme MoaA
MGPYSPFKFVHHKDKIEFMKQGILVTPLQVQIVISNRCNHRCSFCAYRLKNFTTNQLFNEIDVIPTDKVLEIIDDCVDMNVKAIQYTGGGEPTVHPECHKILAHTLNCGLDLALVTNGLALTSEMIHLLAAATWIRVSLDAATPNTYCSIRHVTKHAFSQVLDNIEALAKVKGPDCILGVGDRKSVV